MNDLDPAREDPTQLPYHVYDVTAEGEQVMGSFDSATGAACHAFELEACYPLPGHRYEVRDGLGNPI